MQELRPVMQVREPDTQGRRMLLRTDLYVRTVVQLPPFVRVRERKEMTEVPP